MTAPLDVPIYACAVDVLRAAVAAREAGQLDLCRALQGIARDLDELGDEQADLRAGRDRLAEALSLSGPWLAPARTAA